MGWRLRHAGWALLGLAAFVISAHAACPVPRTFQIVGHAPLTTVEVDTPTSVKRGGRLLSGAGRARLDDGGTVELVVKRQVVRRKGVELVTFRMRPTKGATVKGTITVKTRAEKVTSVVANLKLASGRLRFRDARGASLEPIAPFVIADSSPRHGETGVSAYREIVVRFSAPVDPATIGPMELRASVDGGIVLSRLHVAADRRTATLYPVTQGEFSQAAFVAPGKRIDVRIDGDAIRDACGRALDADSDGVPGGLGTFHYTMADVAPTPATSVYGRIFASELGGAGADTNVPLPGVVVTVDGAETSIRATTDASGNFVLGPVPAGRFFVHIEGQSSTAPVPAGAYYPTVGKAWESVAGRSSSVGDIYLPLIPAGTLVPTSSTAPTVVTVAPDAAAANPALAAVRVTVAAGSLFADDGIRGGSVGIAPVAATRLPGPLPAGLELPLVFTVQTGGTGPFTSRPSNFDVPASVVLPNLPDPLTGLTAGPGEKSALWSYDHDTGDWTIVGTMTVSADGATVQSDAGSGIRAPGWHGTSSGAQCLLYLLGVLEDFDPCGSASWRRALDEAYPAAVTDSLDAAGATVQSIHDGTSSYRYDRFSVVVDRMPPGVTPEAFLVDLARDPNATVHSDVFDAMNEFTRRPGQGDTPHVGDIYDINIVGPEPLPDPFDGDVVLSRLGSDHFVFTTIHTPEHGYHPESGSREFGFVRLPGGAVEFYTAGASRPTYSGLGVLAVGSRHLQNVAWTGLMLGIDAAIRERGGRMREESFGAEVHYVPGPSPCESGSDAKQASVQVELGRPWYRVDFSREQELPSFPARSTFGRASNNASLEVVVPARAFFHAYCYDAATGMFGECEGFAAEPGRIPSLTMRVAFDAGADDDGDGLGMAAEYVLGTDPSDADSDDDGVPDGAEALAGSNPTDGGTARTGLVASVATAGAALDITAAGDVVAVIDDSPAVSAYNVFSGMSPALLARVPLQGEPVAVACSQRFVAAAERSRGLVIADLAAATGSEGAVRTYSVDGDPTCVTVLGDRVCIGTDTGQLRIQNLASGEFEHGARLAAAIHDVQLSSSTLYAITSNRLYLYDVGSGCLDIVGSVTANGAAGSVAGRRRLFVEGGRAYVTYRQGCDVYDVSNRAAPVLLRHTTTAQFGWKQFLADGSGIAVAAVGTNSSSDGLHDLNVYDLSDPTRTDVFLATLTTPGLAHSLVLAGGLAFTADGDAGLSVCRYAASGNDIVPPSVALVPSGSGSFVAAGELIHLVASATDDNRVARVDLRRGGALIASDTTFPFEFAIPTGAASSGAELSYVATATDVLGNAASSAATSVSVGPAAVRDTAFGHDVNGRLFVLDLDTGCAELVGTMGISIYDLATAPDGSLYALPSGGDALYQVHRDTAELTFVGYTNVNADLNGLAFDGSGVLWAAGDDTLARLDTSTGSGTVAWDLDGFACAGDIVFPADGKAHISTRSGRVIAVDLSTGGATSQADIGESDLFGLVMSRSGTIVGLTSDGRLLDIDASTGVATYRTDLHATFPVGTPGGAGSR